MSRPAVHKTVDEAAIEWATRLSHEGSDPKVQAAFEQWHAADARHAAAFNRAAGLWRDLSGLGGHQDEAAIAAMAEPLWRERIIDFARQRIAGLAALSPRHLAAGGALVAALVLLLILPVGEQISPAPDHETSIAEIRDIPLEDGSVITLGAATRMEVAFTAEARRVRLGEGEAFFTIEKDATRPFFVEAGETLIQVVGTQFDVRRSSDQVRVSVLEGVVEVHHHLQEQKPAAAPAHIHVLTAGEEAIARTAQAEVNVSKVTDIRPGAWREGRLSYDGVPLKEVIFDANRYHAGQIIIASEEIAGLKVTTSYRAEQVETMIRTLEDILPLRAERLGDGRVLLHAVEKGA